MLRLRLPRLSLQSRRTLQLNVPGRKCRNRKSLSLKLWCFQKCLRCLWYATPQRSSLSLSRGLNRLNARFLCFQSRFARPRTLGSQWWSFQLGQMSNQSPTAHASDISGQDRRLQRLNPWIHRRILEEFRPQSNVDCPPTQEVVLCLAVLATHPQLLCFLSNHLH